MEQTYKETKQIKWPLTCYLVLFVVILSVTSGISCKNTPGVKEASITQKDYPESVLLQLPEDARMKVDDASAQIVVPDDHPFNSNSDLISIYSHWYRKGYAYVIVTGIEHKRDQVSRAKKSAKIRAKIQGWFDGNSDGAHVSLYKTIGEAAEQIDHTQNR